MKQLVLLFAILFAFSTCGCAQEKPTLVLIETELGNMTVKLYDDTPLHRDNFVKLVNENYYNETLFHRVIDGFMIQGGDPESIAAAPNQRLGGGGPGYLIDAEIIYPKHYHKKGALAAARQADQANPDRNSSGSQFYIVQGEKVQEEQLQQLKKNKEQQREQAAFVKYVMPFRSKLIELQKEGDEEGLQKLMDKLRADAELEIASMPAFEFTPTQIEDYMTIGGTPQLDGDYTVFGEVIEGVEVIDKIAELETDQFDRPIIDVKMKMSIIK